MKFELEFLVYKPRLNYDIEIFDCMTIKLVLECIQVHRMKQQRV